MFTITCFHLHSWPSSFATITISRGASPAIGRRRRRSTTWMRPASPRRSRRSPHPAWRSFRARAPRHDQPRMQRLRRTHGRRSSRPLRPFREPAAARHRREPARNRLRARHAARRRHRPLDELRRPLARRSAFAPVMDCSIAARAVAYVHPTVADCCRNLLPGIADWVIEYRSIRRARSPPAVQRHAGALPPHPLHLRPRRWHPAAAGRASRSRRGRQPELAEKAPQGVRAHLRKLHYDTALRMHRGSASNSALHARRRVAAPPRHRRAVAPERRPARRAPCARPRRRRAARHRMRQRAAPADRFPIVFQFVILMLRLRAMSTHVSISVAHLPRQRLGASADDVDRQLGEPLASPPAC